MNDLKILIHAATRAHEAGEIAMHDEFRAAFLQPSIQMVGPFEVARRAYAYQSLLKQRLFEVLIYGNLTDHFLDLTMRYPESVFCLDLYNCYQELRSELNINDDNQRSCCIM